MAAENIFEKKKILIYGIGKSGLSSYNFLKKKNYLFLYDDEPKIIKNKEIKKKLIKPNDIINKNFDFIVLSPGIDINKCYISNFLRKNKKKIITDLDIFCSCYYNNKNITITGTNGKSTTAKILYQILKDQNKDVRLAGNIGNPILSEKKITSKTIFVIEASSYQIEYSRYFRANYALILNISADHLERHGSIKNYVKSKFKLIRNQKKEDYSFFNKNNKYLKNEYKKNKVKSKNINVNLNIIKKNLIKIKNSYFLTDGNKENLSFVFAVSKYLNLNYKNLIKSINNFKGLKFRQQIIYSSKKITLINDSKATSYSSSINILKSLSKVYWIIGGIPKKDDKFLLSKKECLNFRGYIFGKYRNYFYKNLKNKMSCEKFISLTKVLKKIMLDIKNQKSKTHQTILFSPSGASFDYYKNFEDRGNNFNTLIKKLNIKKKLDVY
jgi:UDP-N-acetylmuramoylalanine--D-glutamate ligase